MGETTKTREILGNNGRNIEKIGSIALDYTCYSGEDLYCDGDVEDEILDIVRSRSQVEYPEIIEEKKSWPILYHLSEQRGNVVDWLPIEGGKVLEVGSGCGAITGVLASKASSVDCVDLSGKRSMINAYRHSECSNVTIHVGNFKDIEPKLDTDYDYICLIGVFEYAQGYIGGDTPYEDFLRILLRHLGSGGRLVIAIENKYGLKYFAGCREDHLGVYFSGIENYADGGGVRTFGRYGLEKLLKAVGVEEYHFYYPYPDYKFMTALYSDEYQPGKGELTDNIRNFDRDRMLLFDEKNAFDGIIEEGVFPFFSNSFLVVTGKNQDIKFVKYSNDRAPEYAIRTQIMRSADGRKAVRKYPMSDRSSEHVRQMYTAYRQLTEKYAGSSLSVNKCRLCDEDKELYAEFEYVEGVPLSEIMDGCLERGDTEKFYRYFREYLEKTGYNSEFPATDFDLIFSNILIDKDKWNLIDYEWTFGRKIDIKELAFRAVYCYILENEKRERLDTDRLLRELGITEAEAEAYREQERNFQSFVTGGRMSMSQIRDLLGGELKVPQKWIDKYGDLEVQSRVQIYEDTGDGFSEEGSYFVKDAFKGDSLIEFEINVSGNVRRLRIDPSFYSCMIKLREMSLNGSEVPLGRKKVLLSNGKIIKASDKDKANSPCIVFSTDDPNIYIDLTMLDRQGDNRLYVSMDIVRLPADMACDMAGAVKRLI
ncbi:MAG: class I SAM-dependent methyltransferase [Lachnospiraceae bacterium]|nr:class I SAM-dependent methyltransferase [Lachnospiraceae bacterium]